MKPTSETRGRKPLPKQLKRTRFVLSVLPSLHEKLKQIARELEEVEKEKLKSAG